MYLFLNQLSVALSYLPNISRWSSTHKSVKMKELAKVANIFKVSIVDFKNVLETKLLISLMQARQKDNFL